MSTAYYPLNGGMSGEPTDFFDASAGGSQIGEYMLCNSVMLDGGFDVVGSSVHFDRYEELIWTVNRGGHFSGYFGPHMQKYVSIPIQKDLRQVVACSPLAENGVFVLAKNSVHLYSKFGQSKWSYSCPGMTMDLITLLHDQDSHSMSCGGHQERIIQLDTETGRLTRSTDIGPNGCVVLRAASRFLCAADPTGTVSLFDKNTGRIEQRFETINGQLSDMTVQEYLLVTCGWSQRLDGALLPDRLLKVYDLRVMRPIPPFSAHLDPDLVRFLPALHDRLLVANLLGEFQFLQLGQSIPASPVYSLGFPITDLDISSSCRCLIISDDVGGVHLFTADTGDRVPRFNVNSFSTVFPDDPVYSHNPISLDNESLYFTSIPFGYPKPTNLAHNAVHSLASDWPEELCRNFIRKVKPIDEEILRTVNQSRGLSIARKPSSWGRTYFPYFMQSELNDHRRVAAEEAEKKGHELVEKAKHLSGASSAGTPAVEAEALITPEEESVGAVVGDIVRNLVEDTVVSMVKRDLDSPCEDLVGNGDSSTQNHTSKK